MPTLTEKDIEQTVKAQGTVFNNALEIHRERTAQYGMLWKEDTPLDTSFLVKHKAKRLNKTLLDAHVRGEAPDPDAVLESALDLINYAGFIVRQVVDDG